MKKNAKRFFSMLLAFSMVFGLLVFPAAATETEETAEAVGTVEETAPADETAEETAPASEEASEAVPASDEADEPAVTVEGSAAAFTLNADEIDLSNVSAVADEDVAVDENSPAIIALEDELKGIKVLNEEGKSVPLTETEIQQLLALYQQYMNHWAANADILGVQTPFFLAYNDTQDSLGVLGEMLALANIPLAAVRAGQVPYSDLSGMLETFLFADMLGVQFYGGKVAAARDEVIKAIEESGAQTEVQKLLVLNDWMAHNTNFDMSYIMNSGLADGEKPMVAPTPVDHENKQNVYSAIEGIYKQNLDTQFRAQIENGLMAQLAQQYYEQAIRQAVYQSELAKSEVNEEDVIENYRLEKYSEAYAAKEKEIWDAEYKAAYAKYQQDSALTEAELDAKAKVDADAAVENSQSEIATYATTEAEKAMEALTEEEIQKLTNAALTGDEATETEYEKAAGQAANAFMEANKDAIAKDPADFVKTTFGEEAAAQMAAGCDQFLADCKQNGVPGMVAADPTIRVPVSTIIDEQMKTPMADLGGMTPNDAIPIYAAQAAAGMTEPVLNYWQGSQFGALGRGSAVCLGYTKAFAYLVQYMHPEVYGKNGADTDMSVAANWKTAEELYYNEKGELDINRNYVVDAVRISFNANVTMYGVEQANFTSDHFWNAVKVDGKWYYIDPCYTDVFTEVMSRDRVETDGDMNYLYFMFSHSTAMDLYEGNYSTIKTLYYDEMSKMDYTSAAYEDAWVSRIKSNTYFDGTYAYYLYDSTDMLTILEMFEEDMTLDFSSTYKLVRHKLDGDDYGDGDTDYETLVVFNEETDNGTVARVWNPATQKMEDSALLTDLYQKHVDYEQIYPSLAIGAALYSGKVYFNLANCVLSYDISSGKVALVKEYNTVYGVRDDTNAFGGMAFTTTTAANADFTIENHPIAGMTIKEDGKMYVSIATNFGFISGKDPYNPADQSSYGYEYEETNYNSDFSRYTEDSSDMDSILEFFGYSKETNDNDEFMWSANFVETLDMAHLAGNSHSYAAVTVEPFCGVDGYTENRCTVCGAVEAGTRVIEEGTACAHHYIEVSETYYTKDEDGNWNTGTSYVCTVCGFSISEPTKPLENDFVDIGELMDQYNYEKALYDEAVATAGHDYVPTDAVWAADGTSVTFTTLECSSVCSERKNTLDCLRGDNTITVKLSQPFTAKAELVESGDDYVIYAASGEAEGYAFTASVKITLVESSVTRISGKDRYKTAYAVADELKRVMNVESFDTMIVAYGVNFPDALAGSYLSTELDAPILLTDKKVDADVQAYIKENLTEGGKVYILGGSAAVSVEFEDGLKAAGIDTERLSGKDRYATNLVILDKAGLNSKEILVCTGINYADSLSASASNMPILLVNPQTNKLTTAQEEYLEALGDGYTFYIVGGEGAVSKELATALAEYGTVERISGKTREVTSVKVAETFIETVDCAVLAYSRNFPDGLCGGLLAYKLGAPMLLVDATFETYAKEYVAENGIEKGYVLGGSAAVPNDVIRTVFGMADNEVIK